MFEKVVTKGVQKVESKDQGPLRKQASQIAANIKGQSVGRKNTTLKKLSTDTVKLLATLRERANKKDFGRKVRDSDLIHLGLTKITPDDLEVLKEISYSEQDRLRLAHEAYQKSHGKITLDQFIGKLLRGETPNTQLKSS